MACQNVNTVINRAQELGVPFVDFELLRDEIHLDYSTDFRDHTHLSMYGAEKSNELYIGLSGGIL